MKRKKCRLFAVIAVLVFGLQSISAFASETQTSNKAIVFVLDASGSMKTNDPNRLAIDSIAQLVYTLPTDYKAGLIAYNTEVILSQGLVLNAGREDLITKAHTIKYADYTNAGAGLKRAVEMLAEVEAAEKHIVLLSDGEIRMADQEATNQSAAAYQEAIVQAVRQEVNIHVMGLGNEMEHGEQIIFSAAAETGGHTYYTPQAVGIQQAINMILEEQLQVKRIVAAIADTEDGMSALSIDLPYTYASKLRVLLTGNTAIRNLHTNFQADAAKQMNGERYSFIEIDRPQSKRLNLSFCSDTGNRVVITLIPEYHVIPKATVTGYEDMVPETAAAVSYERKAAIQYTFYDADNQKIQLWAEDFFNHNVLSIKDKTQAEAADKALLNGRILMEREVPESLTLHTTIDYSAFPVNILGSNETEVFLEGPPLLPEEESEPPYLPILFSIIIILAAGLLLWLLNRKKTEPAAAGTMPEPDRPKPGKFSYTGRLNIYIARTVSGYDIPPLSYDLFRLPQGKVISLQEVLESCGVTERFEGASRIYVRSGANRSIILTNNSDCTIMKSSEILMKQKSYPLSANAKLDIMFEDEISEMMLQYKDLRPSEMR